MTPVADPFMTDTRPTGLQRGRGGFLRSADDAPWVTDPSDEICKTTAAVFQEDGYQVSALTAANMVFQKQGSHGQSLAYGGVVDTYYGGTTVVRVRAQLVDLGAKGYRLQCQAYMVRNAEDSFFEDESRLTNIRRMPYQSLLDKVAERLK